MRPYLAALLILASCAVLAPVRNKEEPAPSAAAEQPAAPEPRKEEIRHPKPKAQPPSATVQVPAPQPLPTVEHCAKLEAGSAKATVRAKLDCLIEAPKK